MGNGRVLKGWLKNGEQAAESEESGYGALKTSGVEKNLAIFIFLLSEPFSPDLHNIINNKQ